MSNVHSLKKKFFFLFYVFSRARIEYFIVLMHTSIETAFRSYTHFPRKLNEETKCLQVWLFIVFLVLLGILQICLL